MKLISKNHGSPLLSLIEAMPVSVQRDIHAIMPERRVHLNYMGSYKRLHPSARENFKYYLWDQIPEAILNELRENRADLLLDTSIETIFLQNTDVKTEFAEIYGAMHDLGISPKRVIIAHSNLAAQQYHESLVAELGISEPMRLWTLDFAMLYTALALENDPGIRQKIENGVDKPFLEKDLSHEIKPFLFLNRKVKQHRAAILLALSALVGEDKLLFSLLGGGETHSKLLRRLLDDAANLLTENNSYANVDWHKTAASLAERFPITLPEDVGSFGNAINDAFRSVDAKWYDATLMSIVGETLFSAGENLFITEKIMKPIYWSHPFVVAGDPGTLARLRALGFRTFGSVIDESYDEINDPIQRLHAIIEELRRIGSFNAGQLQQARRMLALDVQHNFNHVRHGFRQVFADLLVDSFAKVAKEGRM